ncbi:hypothetical protein JCM18549_07980 [Halolamina salina]
MLALDALLAAALQGFLAAFAEFLDAVLHRHCGPPAVIVRNVAEAAQKDSERERESVAEVCRQVSARAGLENVDRKEVEKPLEGAISRERGP